MCDERHHSPKLRFSQHSSCLLFACVCVFLSAGIAESLNGQTQTQAATKKHRTIIRDAGHRKTVTVKSWTELRTHRVVMQQRDYSCGAASLATLLKYHIRDDISETDLLLEVVNMLTDDEMRERIENGLSLTDLRRLAVRRKYLARPFRPGNRRSRGKRECHEADQENRTPRMRSRVHAKPPPIIPRYIITESTTNGLDDMEGRHSSTLLSLSIPVTTA